MHVEATIERVLHAALATFAGLPGATIADEHDHTRLATRTPHAPFNNVLGLRLDGADLERRIGWILGRFVPHSLPVTWWVTPLARPGDVGTRLLGLGFEPIPPEFGMVLDLGPGLPPLDGPPGSSLETVRTRAALDEWLDVMGGAYAWSDRGKADLIRGLYVPWLATPDLPTPQHFIARLDGRPVACSSLYVVAGEAFVTNIGTVPAARGRGMGRLATLATLHLARQAGHPRAMLTASLDGREVYRRLGFAEYGRLDRYLAGPAAAARLGLG